MKNLYECVSNGDILTNRELIDLVHDRGLITDVQWATLSYKHHLNEEPLDEDIVIEYLESLDDPLELVKKVPSYDGRYWAKAYLEGRDPSEIVGILEDPRAVASKILSECSNPIRIIEDAGIVDELSVKEIADMLEDNSQHAALMKELIDRWVS